MKIKDITNMVEASIDELAILQPWHDRKDSYDVYGLRFESKLRVVGELVGNSKDNPDRADERDFPEYDSPEYNNLPELDGTCAWRIDEHGGKAWMRSYMSWHNDPHSEDTFWGPEHCYIIGGEEGNHDCPDDNEVVIRNAVVLAVIF